VIAEALIAVAIGGFVVWFLWRMRK